MGSPTNCVSAVVVCSAGTYSFNSSCYSVCPNNTYTFGSECILECPSGYVGSISASTSTCVICSSSCVQDGFSVSTKVVNGGNNYEHTVTLSSGISTASTAEGLKSGMTIELTTGVNRLLLSTVTLSVHSVSISSNRQFITILTNYYAADPASSRILVNFQAGTLYTSSGSTYSQLSGTVFLYNPTYLSSFYNIFGTNHYLQV